MYTLPEALQKRLDRLKNPGGTPVIVYKVKIVIRIYATLYLALKY